MDVFIYAEIENGICFAISYLSGEVIKPTMIKLEEGHTVELGDIYEDGEWRKPEVS